MTAEIIVAEQVFLRSFVDLMRREGVGCADWWGHLGFSELEFKGGSDIGIGLIPAEKHQSFGHTSFKGSNI